ncbi:MAG: rod shape-determining protein MreC [Coriobacteriales bacterium]|jgi:rod shape-determining protein MreC
MVQLGTQNSNRRSSATVALIITVVLSFACLALWSGEGDGGFLHSTRNAVAAITSPLQRVASFISVPFNAISDSSTNASATTEDLLTLQQENEDLTVQNVQLNDLKSENAELKELLDLKNSYSVETTGATVISRSTDSWNRTITIDKGSADGMEVGMPVMDASNGLIGQIQSVSATSSVVLLLTDENSGVSVTLQNSGEQGILTGSVDGLLYLEYISTSTGVEVGEAVTTSGLGGTFPKGIVVGKVSRVDSDSSDTYLTIVVEPLGSIGISDYVLVITGETTELTYPTTSSSSSTSDSSSEQSTTTDSSSTSSSSTDTTTSSSSDTSSSSSSTSTSSSSTTTGDTSGGGQ